VPPTIVYLSSDGNDDASGIAADQALRTLSAAIELVAPGGTIALLPGTYPPIEISNIHGTEDEPIRVRASPGTIFTDIDLRTGAAVMIENSSHLELSGITVRNALWGIYVSSSNNIRLLANDVAEIGQEAIRVNNGSHTVTIEGNRIADTGRRSDIGIPNGEGIYIGTGTPAGVDHVRDVLIRNNTIERTTDEAIDVKRPSTGIHIIGNEISDVVTNTSGAVVIHLNGDDELDPDIRIAQNVIRNVTRSSPFRDGNCIVVQTTVTVVNNILHGCEHRGIYVRGTVGLARIEHNTFLEAGPVGAIVSDGVGQEIISRNNLGAPGDENRPADPAAFADPQIGDYRIVPDMVDILNAAPAIGVVVDLLGFTRPAEGPVTFGAVQAPAS
jgi:hypothetical protein